MTTFLRARIVEIYTQTIKFMVHIEPLDEEKTREIRKLNISKVASISILTAIAQVEVIG